MKGSSEDVLKNATFLEHHENFDSSSLFQAIKTITYKSKWDNLPHITAIQA